MYIFFERQLFPFSEESVAQLLLIFETLLKLLKFTVRVDTDLHLVRHLVLRKPVAFAE